MRKIINAVVLAAVTTLAVPAIASAHVVVKPAEVETAAFQTFTTSVPNEKDVAVTGLRVVIPSGVQHVTPTVKTGWEITTKKSGENVTEITWSAGTIPVGMRDDFTFSAQAPVQPTDLHWKAYQTYEDGTVVSWDQAASEDGDHNDEGGNSGPYSTTKVVDSMEDAEQSATTSATGAYVLAALALIVGLSAFIVKRK